MKLTLAPFVAPLHMQQYSVFDRKQSSECADIKRSVIQFELLPVFNISARTSLFSRLATACRGYAPQQQWYKGHT